MEIEGTSLSAAKEFSVVLFRVNEMQCAADVEPVASVMRVKEILAEESMPPCVAGIAPFQQEWRPVIDLESRWGNSTGKASRFCVIVAQVSEQLLGFRVTECAEVVPLALEQVSSLPSLLARTQQAPCVWGLAQMDDDLVPLIEWESILSPEELKQLSTWAQSHSGSL